MQRTIDLTKQSLALLTQIGDQKSRCGNLSMLGGIYLRLGGLNAAERYLQQALAESVTEWQDKFIYEDLSAPCLLHQVAGDLAIETLCTANPSADDYFGEQAPRPAIGGLLLWQDAQNYLCLTSGQYGRHELIFSGCIDNEILFFGRGCLLTKKLSLRLERCGRRVSALCSADEERWFSVGHADVAFTKDVQVGVYAVGAIYRLIYPGAFPKGASISFKSLRLWQDSSG